MNLLFLIAGLLSICGALGVLLAKQPVHQVLSTVLNFIGLAVLYLSLSSEFMAVIQMIIYGGAVMVLFLFVIALLTARKEPIEQEQPGTSSTQVIAGWSIGLGILTTLSLAGLWGRAGGTLAALPEGFGSVGNFGQELLTTHLLPFELTAVVLMVAVIGVVILVGRQQR